LVLGEELLVASEVEVQPAVGPELPVVAWQAVQAAVLA
jgi:hypothetical protein